MYLPICQWNVGIREGLAALKWVSRGYTKSLDKEIGAYDQNPMRNEFFGHENISIATCVEKIGTVVCDLCCYVNDIL